MGSGGPPAGDDGDHERLRLLPRVGAAGCEYKQRVMGDSKSGARLHPQLQYAGDSRGRVARLLERMPGRGRGRTVVRALTAMLAIGLVSALPAADWPLFLGNSARNSIAPEALEPPLEVRWVYEAPGGVDSTAIIVDGSVYFGEMDGRFHSVSLATGEPNWMYQANLGVPASGCITDGKVFFGDEEGYFHAVNIETGQQEWVYQTFAEILSSPHCSDEAVLVGSYDTHLYAFDPGSGDLLWKYQTEDRVNSSPAVVGGKTFITGCDGKFRVIDIATGDEDSFVDMKDYVAASPAVLGSSAYVGTFGYQVLKIDWGAGKVAWRYDHPETDYEFFASPVVSEGLVVIGGRDKRVHAIDEQTGELRWDFETRSRVDSSPALAGDVIWVGSMDGHLYALRHEDGSLLWKFAIGGRVVASPAIAGGAVVIGSRSGEVYCLARAGQ